MTMLVALASDTPGRGQQGDSVCLLFMFLFGFGLSVPVSIREPLFYGRRLLCRPRFPLWSLESLCSCASSASELSLASSGRLSLCSSGSSHCFFVATLCFGDFVPPVHVLSQTNEMTVVGLTSVTVNHSLYQTYC